MTLAEQIINATNLDKAADLIRAELAVNDAWVVRAILAIYARQTADEQQSYTTKHYNKVGFSGIDSTILSKYAVQIGEFNKGRSKFRTPLSRGQMACARKLMMKYAKQLARIARERREAAAVTAA